MDLFAGGVRLPVLTLCPSSGLASKIRFEEELDFLFRIFFVVAFHSPIEVSLVSFQVTDAINGATHGDGQTRETKRGFETIAFRLIAGDQIGDQRICQEQENPKSPGVSTDSDSFPVPLIEIEFLEGFGGVLENRAEALTVVAHVGVAGQNLTLVAEQPLALERVFRYRSSEARWGVHPSRRWGLGSRGWLLSRRRCRNE